MTWCGPASQRSTGRRRGSRSRSGLHVNSRTFSQTFCLLRWSLTVGGQPRVLVGLARLNFFSELGRPLANIPGRRRESV